MGEKKKKVITGETSSNEYYRYGDGDNAQWHYLRVEVKKLGST